MELLLTKQIVGIRNRGLPTESKHIYAYPGDKVQVIFNNLNHSSDSYFICEKNDQNFVVFYNQFNFFTDNEDYEDITLDKIKLINDLLYSKSTKTFENTIFE